MRSDRDSKLGKIKTEQVKLKTEEIFFSEVTR